MSNALMEAAQPRRFGWQDTWPVQMAKNAIAAFQLPGQVAAGVMNVQPAVPDQWSDVDEATAQANQIALYNRAVDLAGLVMGGTFGSAPVGALGAGPVRPQVQMDYLKRALNRSGIETYGEKGSSLSSSRYLEASIPDWSRNKIGPLEADDVRYLKIRASDHDLPPTYARLNGEADVEIGPHGSAAGETWHNATRWILDKAGVKPDLVTQRALSRVERQAKADRDAKDTAYAAHSAAIRADLEKKNKAADDAWRNLLQRRNISPVVERPSGFTNLKSLERYIDKAEENYKKFGWNKEWFEPPGNFVGDMLKLYQ